MLKYNKIRDNNEVKKGGAFLHGKREERESTETENKKVEYSY